MVELAQRIVPGAPPPSQSKTANKKKKQAQRQQNAVNRDQNHSQEAVSRAATEASLMEKAPSHDKINESVKVQAKDLAEEAERNGAIAAAQIIIDKDAGSNEKESKSALQVILTKRIKVLSKKLQRAIAYEALEEEKLNADMKRIIASKPALEAGVAELTEASKALEIAEQESDKLAKIQTKLAVEAVRRDLIAENEKRGSVLCQFLHLYSLIQPSTPSFAPPPMPAALAQATSQEIAAVARLYSDLSSSTEVVPQDDKNSLISKLVSASEDNVLEGVSFQRLLALVEGSSGPVVEQFSSEKEEVQPLAPSAGGILFMQKSEIEEEENSGVVLEATEEVKQAEPEGGAVNGVSIAEIRGGATERGEASGKGPILGENAVSSHGNEDGTAKAQVEEPITTTEVSAKETQQAASAPPAKTSNGPARKTIDWAADDDDWGDMMIQPEPEPKKVNAPNKNPTAAVPKVNGASSDPAVAHQKGEKHHSSKGQQRERQNPHRQNGHHEAHLPIVAKGAPEVDEDGFTVASSKRTKMLQQQQQQQQQASQRNNANRGGGPGKGSFRGQGGRGSGSVARGGGGSFAENRGHGRNRGPRQGGENMSEV